MDNTRLTRVLLILLIILAGLVLAQMLLQLASGFSDLILLFLLAWLVSFMLNPIVFSLSGHPVPPWLTHALNPALGPDRAIKFDNWHLSRGLAVTVSYLGLVLVVVVLVGMFAPTAVTQLSQLANRMPEYMARAPEASTWAQTQLARMGINLKVEDAVRSALSGLQGYAATLIQNALGILSSIVGL